MIDYYSHIFSKGISNAFELLIVLSVCFLMLSILLVLFILYLRVYKNIRNLKKQNQENILVEFINAYLFDEDFDHKEDIETFKANYLRTRLEKKITIKEILIYNQNLKGESTYAIKKLFLDLGLDKVVFKDLNQGPWHHKARAIYVLSQLGIPVHPQRLKKLLNHKKDEIREQALLHYLKLADNDPLDFLDKIEKPLTTWLQIAIENALKYTYKGPIPDFSRWINHPMESVSAFAMRMSAEYNQFENITAIVPFLDHPDENLRKEAVVSLRKLGYDEAIDILTPSFGSETPLVKKEILKTIKELGSYYQLQVLAPYIAHDEKDVELEYLRIEQYFVS